MSNAFVDTTVLCNALELSGQKKATEAKAALSRYTRTESPVYSLKELRAGPLSSWILAHNIVAAESTIEDAVARLGKASAFKPRQGSVSSFAIISGLIDAIHQMNSGSKPAGEPEFDAKLDLENHLAIRILKAWKKRRTVVTKIVQPLACFVDGELELVDRQLKFEGGAECSKRASCGAALELKKRSSIVTQLLKSVFPPPPKGQTSKEKHEKTRRRQALKEVLANAAADFPRKDCRALGDAYFCVMSPDGSDILTTNFSDFDEMAKELGKPLAAP